MSVPSSITRFAPPERFDEKELAGQHRCLSEDEELCTLLNAMPEFVMVLSPTRQVLLGNKALTDFATSQGCSSILGMRPGEILSCRHAQSAPSGCGTGDACRTCGMVEAILGALDGGHASRECRILRDGPNGMEALDYKIYGAPFRWHGEALALVVAVDISNEKRRKVLERIFFHDLLNTAGIVSGLTELLAKGILDFEETKEKLSETVQALVNEIMGQRDLLAAENSELSAVPTPLHSRIFLDAVAHTYRSTSQGRDRTILVAPGLDETIFYSDERLLGRVIGNLLKNALEATPEGGTVTLGCRVEGDEITFWCNNCGVIPPDIQNQIFHRSFSTKEPGRGIGTYSVKLLTERYLKGWVAFSSNPTAGTTFSVTYPLELKH